MLYGVCPYEERTLVKLITAINEDQIQFHEQTNPISNNTKELLLRMLTKDPNQRISWKELFERELNNSDLGYQMLSHPIVQTIQYNSRRNKESKAFKFILNERNKVYYVYSLVDELYELKKEEVSFK